jgi:hypothetical protein
MSIDLTRRTFPGNTSLGLTLWAAGNWMRRIGRMRRQLQASFRCAPLEQEAMARLWILPPSIAPSTLPQQPVAEWFIFRPEHISAIRSTSRAKSIFTWDAAPPYWRQTLRLRARPADMTDAEPNSWDRFQDYSEQLQQIANRYMRETGNTTATARKIGAWAIQNRLWEPQPAALIRQCAEELSRAMREEYMTDPQGRRVRAKHVAIIDRAGEQMPLWADIRGASREHMEIAFQQRRQQIVGDCRQLKADVDSYNENYNAGPAIQMVFDFTEDLEELEAFFSVT